MKNSVRRTVALSTLTCVLLIGLLIAVLNAGSYIRERDSYVEVGGGKIAYVPRTAEYVNVNGHARRIVRFEATLTNAGKDCKCPKCCDGHCYVIVLTDGGARVNPIITLGIVWVACT